MATETASQPLVTVYTPVSPFAEPRRLIRDIRRDFSASTNLAWRLFLRNLNSRYRQTLLGYVWAFVPPIMTTAVFVYLQRSGYFSVGSVQVPYVVFVLAGLVLWQVFADALIAPLRMVQQSIAMLSKVNFPREALILAGMGEVLFSFVVRALLLGAVMVVYGVTSGWTIVASIAGVAALAGFGLALGLLLTPLALLYHDVGQGLPFVLQLWMFLTPVIYPAPQSSSGLWLMLLNPTAPLLDTTRAWLFGSTPQFLGLCYLSCAVAVLAFVAGWLVYRLALPIVMDRVIT